jgi:hypothetical protein
MKTIEVSQWRIRGVKGKLHTTRWHTTEEDIKTHHPEAVRVAGSLIVRSLREPDEPWQDLYPRGVLDFVKGLRDAPNSTQAGQMQGKPKP